jgi:hypothetical protein
MKNPDHISERLERIVLVKILKFFDADPGWKKFGSGMEKNSDPGSATLRKGKKIYYKKECFGSHWSQSQNLTNLTHMVPYAIKCNNKSFVAKKATRTWCKMRSTEFKDAN